MVIPLRKEKTSLEISDILARSPLEASEAFVCMVSLAQALCDLHEEDELWDHCEKGVEILPDSSTIIHGTLTERNSRLQEGEVDINRSVAPPEYITNNIHDARSDIFAWGVVAYELITGECPLKGEAIVELIEAAQACNFTPPNELRKDFPERLNKIVLRALSKYPQDRFQSASALLKALNEMQ